MRKAREFLQSIEQQPVPVPVPEPEPEPEPVPEAELPRPLALEPETEHITREALERRADEFSRAYLGALRPQSIYRQASAETSPLSLETRHGWGVLFRSLVQLRDDAVALYAASRFEERLRGTLDLHARLRSTYDQTRLENLLSGFLLAHPSPEQTTSGGGPPSSLTQMIRALQTPTHEARGTSLSLRTPQWMLLSFHLEFFRARLQELNQESVISSAAGLTAAASRALHSLVLDLREVDLPAAEGQAASLRRQLEMGLGASPPQEGEQDERSRQLLQFACEQVRDQYAGKDLQGAAQAWWLAEGSQEGWRREHAALRLRRAWRRVAPLAEVAHRLLGGASAPAQRLVFLSAFRDAMLASCIYYVRTRLLPMLLGISPIAASPSSPPSSSISLPQSLAQALATGSSLPASLRRFSEMERELAAMQRDRTLFRYFLRLLWRQQQQQNKG